MSNTPDVDFHGWRAPDSDVAIHIGRMPGRKSICLYVHEGSVVHVLAYFRGEAEARKAMEVIDDMTHTKGATA